ncbi:MAG: RHS repeat-associated core domain-containing protein, partial [Treponema sp.]|uniref:RHS repeat-associated core domain-containing protein n=1 Tax=Treponema sp. TaxID=166 RepID=UPI00298DBBC2
MDLKAETSLITKLPYRFSAKELDEETGLYYYGARYLDPKMSRWISADPAMNTGEYFDKTDSGMGGIYNHVNFNLYHYAGNNPIKYTDPDGRETVPYEVQKYLIPWNKKHGAVLPHFTETSKWYLNLTIVNTTNCYAYALNLTKNPITNKNFNSTGSKVFAMQPGILAGRDDELREMPLNAPIQDRAAKIVDLAKADTAKGGYLFTETTIDAPVSKEGNWKVALFIAFSTDSKTGETIYNDYHWYRLEDNGLWSHKQGAMPASDKDAAGQRIYDPKHANRFDPPLNYGYFVGYFEVSQCQSQSQ